ncbi:competence type IV pilus major pilin ComGC [Convivina intestini]|uniref:competence type IV pilus major pilin ComGC n=1 Tax=Convivina intestini TaxID=1505726 RepID=UPI00200FE8EB|nr:competence type IV pilus major pilin ComGC [Convivina intestini]CAH1851059.1 hypothetical protein R078131_00217 [Convivina intestini]
MKIMKKTKAFTLIEAAVVLFIIGLLMLLILPNLNVQRKNASQTHAKAMVAMVQTQVDLYQNEHPEASNVTLDDLAREHYLNGKQIDKIKDLKIGISQNEAHQ